MRIYNLFPLLAGPFKDWQPHMARAADLGFDWLFVNPIQKLGRSGSLYSIKDYFALNPALCSRGGPSPEDQCREMIGQAQKLGLRVMIDLVINHCAYDSDLVKQHPEWFVHEGGKAAHPFCIHDGEKVVWKDLAQFDHQHGRDREGLLQYCRQILQYLLDLGFRGFRCDAAYQLPTDTWRQLIRSVKRDYPDALFFAETLGCSPEQTRQTAQAGFDAIFNSSKWWDFDSPWLLEQYHLTRSVSPSISFPESHDTPRLFDEVHGNVAAMEQRYLFAALFSAGVMMPMGFEFGFRKPLHVVQTRPGDWEEGGADLTGFIRQVNQVKAGHPVFQQESVTEIWSTSNPAVLLMWKCAEQVGQEALVILNKDVWNRQHCWIDDLYRYVQGGAPLTDVSPQWPMGFLPTPFDYELPPGVGRVLVTEPRDAPKST